MGYDRIDSMYDALVSDGAQIGTRQQFKKLMLAPGKEGYKNRLGFYQAMKQDGANIGATYEEFGRALGLHAAKPQHKAMPLAQKPVQPVKKQTMKQRAQEVAAQYQKPRQQKAQQPRTAASSGTDYMKNWRLAHMRNDQMNPMQQAQASNMRARMQRAQEQAARQEQQRATPISRSRITPTAKNFNETMQQLSTPEAKQARAKQQREDDARNLAQYEVEGNKFVRNDGQSEGILGNDLLKLVDSSMNEAQELTRQQYQQNLDKMGGIYAPQSVKEQAFRDAQTQEQVNRQNVLMNNLSSKINEIYSQKGMQRHVAESAEKLNMSVEEYVDKYVTPEIMNYAQKALTMRNQEEIMPHGALDYIAKNLSNSIIGMVLAPSVMSRDTRQRLQEGIAIADGDAEIQKVAGHKDETYRSGIGTRFASTAVNMAADSGPLAVIGAGASAAVNTGTRVLTNGLVKAGVMKAAQKLTAQQMAFKVANMTTAQKIMSGLGTRTATSSLNLAGYSGVTAALSQASTGDDTSLQAIGEAGLKGAEHGAVTGAMFGVSGAIMAPWVSKFGITGLEKSTGERLLHGTQKLGATAAGLGVEAGTMMVADNVTGDKDISFGTWLEDVVMVGAFKAGEPSNFVKMGNILHHLTHNSGGNFVIGKNANGSPIAVDIRLTPDEKNELISSASGKNLMDAFVGIDAKSKSVRDKKGNLTLDKHIAESLYKDFMADSEVSQSTKEKVNAAMGLFNTTRGKSYRSVNDVKNKQILEYTKNGTLLTRTSYKNADERRAILYKQKLYRDNDDMLSLIGYSKMKDMQLTDEDGNVTSLALGFLRDNGYATSKDVTDPKNAQLINDLRNPKSALYLDWEKYVDNNGLYGDLKSENTEVAGGFRNALQVIIDGTGKKYVDIDKIMQKDPMKRTDQENKIFYGVKRALEDELFPSGRPHEDQSASQGKVAAEDNNLGTEQPNGEVVLDELRNLRNAEQELEAAMEGNDVFKQVFEKLHQQGLTPAQIYDALIQNGLMQEELTPLAQYINANARVQGMQQATADAIEENVKSFISDWSYHGTLNGQAMNGEQALYVQDSNSRTLLVGSGDVSFDPITGKAKEDSGDMLVCLDPNTKELAYVKADEVTLFQNQPIDQFAAEYRQRLQMRNSEPYNQAAQEQAMQDAAKAQQAPQDNTAKSEDSTTKESDLTKDDTTLTKVDTTSGKDNTTNEDLVPQEQPQQGGEGMRLEDGTPVPFDANGEPDFLKMTPEQGAEVYKMLFEEDAPMQIDSDIKTLEKDLEKVKVSKYEGASVMERAAARKKVKEAIALAEAQVERAKAIKAAMEKKPEAENTGVGTAENAGQYEKERQQGYREGEGGVIYRRQKPEEVGGVRGKEVNVAFSPTEKVAGHVKLVELDTVQASHNNGQLNLLHFGPDWQPKDRSSQASRVEAEKIAGNIDPEQITGSNNAFIGSAPSVNERHETIQGNNRVDALKAMYANHPDQAAKYKQWLIDHAAEFGLNAEDIKKMNKPVIVNELPVDDATAKKLGQMMASGFESGGKRIPEISATINKLGDKMENLANVLLAEGTLGEDAKLSDLINQNSKRALEFLNRNGFIDNTEYENLASDAVTRRQWLENVLKASLFDGNRKTEAAFNTLPGNAQKAVLATFMRDRNSKAEDKIKQNIQKSFEAYNELNQIAGFKNAKNIEQARAAIQAELLNGSNNVFGEASIREKYTNFELELAALYKGLKDQKSLTGLFGEFYDAVQGKVGKELDAFSQGNTEPSSKDEAIEKVFGINNKQENDRRRETESPSESGGEDGAEPAGDRPAGSEPEPVGEEPDDLVNKELVKRITETDEEFEVEGKYGTIYKKKYLIDGDKEVMKVDEPNKDGDYTGSYYEFDGKKYGDLTGVLERIDGNAKAEEMPEGPIYDRKKALIDTKENELGGYLVKYTTDTGEVKTGILMSDSFDPKGLTTDAPINSVAEKFELSSWHGGIDEVTSSDGEVKVKRIDNYRGNHYEIRVPKSKAKGGKYFTDKELLEMVDGHNFETRGNNMLAEFKSEQLKPVLDRLSKMGVKVQEEHKTSEDEGTHFREDRGLQYSKTDTKDVKNSRIIPEDVDKDVSSQIEKKFDDEIERVYGSNITPEERAEIEKATTIFSRTAYSDEWYKDENKVKHVRKGLSSWHNYYNDLAKQFEEAYGITRKTRITTSKTAENNTRDGLVGMPDLSTSRSGNEEAGIGRGDERRMPEEDAKYYRKIIESLAAINRAHDYFVERAEKLASKYGVRGDEWIPNEVIEKVFEDYNSDKNIKKLYELVKEQIKNLDVKFADVSGGENGTVGYYDHGWNSIRINFEELCAHGSTNQDLASTILHEMLHPLTSDIIAMYQKGYADKLTPSQIDAAKEAIDIYNELKQMQKDGKLSNHYGLTNPREMITELATPEWRKALSEIPNGKHWWNRIINTVAKFFGVNKFNKLGELTDTLDKLLSNFGKEQFDFASRHQKELFDEENQGKKVTDPEEIKRLEEEPKIKVYRAMQVIDGKLYPPMAASVGGKLVEANELGQWIRADENPDLAIPDIDPKTGKQKVDKKTGELKWKFKLDKGGRDATGKKATDINAAYNPYWHMSRSPLNDQFKSAWIRPNIVVVECETPVSELTSDYKAERAKDAVGEVDWKSGSVSGEVFKQTGRARKVILSRWCKPVRVLDDAEVAQKAKEFIGDAKVEIPENVLTPKQRIAFEEAGFKIDAPEKGVKKSEQIMEALEKGLTIDNTVLSEDGAKFRMDHGDGNYPTSSVESHIEKVAQKTGGKVQMVSSVDEITNKAARAAIEDGRKITGWYDEKTGEVHLYMPNIHDRYTAEKTIWHEVVGHKGMRELFGEDRFEKFLRDVWYDLDKPENAPLKKLVDEERKYNPLNIYDAIEEGIARLAEDGKGEPGFWNGIKNKVSDFLHEIGYRIAPNTKDVKYLLWLSKNLQKNQNDPYWKLRAEAVKYRLDHERVPTVVAHDGMFYGNDGKVRSMESLTKSEWDEATDGKIHLRTTPSAGTALDRYHRSLDEHGYMFTESYMDNMLSLKKLMNAIVPDKKIEDIASSENPYMLQNTMQGAMSNAAQMFERNVMKPLDKAMADVLDAFDGKKDDEKIRNFNLYMITKHGLERNRVFFVRDFLKKMRRDEKKKQDADFLENSYYSDKEYLDNELKAGNIDLKEYYRQLDESIRNHFDADFEAGEHDYSGIHAIQEVAKSSDPYDDAEAIQSVMDSEAKMESIRKGAVKDYWGKVKAATQYSIDSDYKNGIISSELHGHVSNMFNWYVPLRKYDEATAEDVYGYITEVGDPKSYIGSTIMRARGHKYLSETNVLAQIGAMGNRAIKNGGMNAIRQAFARFARNNSNNNLITETSVWYEKDPMTGIVYERYPDIPEDATADEINQIVSDFNKDMKAKALQNLASKVYRRGSIGYKFQRAENKSQHIVDVKIAGRTHAFIINGNPRAAQALNGLLENSGAKGIMKPLSSISRMMAQLCTSYNPEFVMRNIMRDAEFASSNVTSKEGARYGALWAKYYAQLGLYKGASNISLKDFSGSTGLGLFAKYRNGTLDMSNKVERYFKEFMENGGETGWVQIKNMKDWTKEYKKDVSTERSKLGKGGAALRDFFFGNLENVNEVAENIARFATYCTSRDSNRSIIRSVYDAKEVSTNFNRHGSGDAISSFKNGEMTGAKAAERWAYGFTASYLRHYSMFFNASIQSTNLLVKNLKNHPVGTSINMLAIPFALGALAALGNNVLIASEDEKDRKGVKDPYGELPDYVRRNNLCIYKGKGEFVTIPLAIELRAFYGLGDLAAGLTFSPNVSGQKNPALDAVGCMSQLVPVMDYLGNSSAGKEPLNETIKAIAPSALSPFVEWELNTDWKGAPIERRGDWNEDVPAWQRAYKGTPDGYMALNKFVNAQTNEVAKGNEDMLGNSFLDMVTNPSMLNHYIGGLGGGAATFTERAIGVVKHGKDTETKDIPFLRSLLYTPSEQSSLQRTKSKWYNYKDEMEKMIANVDRLKSKNVPIEKRISNYSDYYRFQNSKDAAKVRVIELAEKQMKQWKKMRDKSSDTESINFANQNIDRIMMEAVDDLDKLN